MMTAADRAPTEPPSFDPASVPISHAATVMLVDDRPGPGGADALHVLMVRRTAKMVFAPAAWVFPGGRVDPDDHHDEFDTMFRGLTDAEASRILDVPDGRIGVVAGRVSRDLRGGRPPPGQR